LARGFVETEFQDDEGDYLMIYYRGQWYVWERGAYRALDVNEHLARLTEFVKQEMDRVYHWQKKQEGQDNGEVVDCAEGDDAACAGCA
jgi:hypothetical protein